LIKSVLITGGSGLVGTALTAALVQKGYHVSHLGRKSSTGAVKSFVWDVDRGFIDPNALTGVDAIVHLAGAGVADKRWTVKRKKEILESRTKSTELIYQTLKAQPNQVQVLVSATAIGYYGLTTADAWCDEQTGVGNDFLASVCKAWEAAADPIELLDKRLVKIRVGVVLSNKGGALQEMTQPVKWFVGSPLGNGKQWVSWIHINDLCSLFIQALEQPEMRGVYNGVAPNPVTNKELTSTLAKVLHRPFWLLPVPAIILKLALGEMSQIVLNGARVSSKKAQSTNLRFQFNDVHAAIENLLGNQSAKSST
jgi:uncharacterized protein